MEGVFLVRPTLPSLILTTMFQKGIHCQTDPAGKVMQDHALNKFISNSALLIAALKFIHSLAKGKRSIVLLVLFRRRLNTLLST